LAPGALTFSIAVWLPAELGMNTTLTVQVDPTGIGAVQVLLCENEPAFVPERVMPVIDSAALPPFVTVTSFGALTVFACTLPKASDVGESVKVGATEVPVSVTLCVPAPLPALMFNIAPFAKVEVGANTTLIVQVDPAEMEVPQVLVCENWLGFVPVSVMLVIVSAALALFVTVTNCGELAVFVCTLPNASDVGETE
jgi:hypothetical protein